MPSIPPPSRLREGDPALDRLRGLARQLDSSIPLPFGARVGWDAVLGLVPGIGDGAGAVLSAIVVMEAARRGAPVPVLMRMVGNVAVEAVVGAIPLVGDVFDAAWKANLRNVALLEQHLAAPGPTGEQSRFLVGAVLVLLVAVLVGGLVLAAVVLTLIARWLLNLGS